MLKKATMGAVAITALLVGLPAGANAADEPAMRKIGPALEYVYTRSSANNNARTSNAASDNIGRAAVSNDREIYVAPVTDDGYARIDAIASGSTDDLMVTMESMGGRNMTSYGRTVSAEFPASRLGELGASNTLAFARPVLASTNVGLVDSQGDRSMRTDKVRQTSGLSGRDIKVGILSDSFACDPGSLNSQGVYTTPAEDVANGDTPEVEILSDFLDQTTCIDEGRAMAQLIYDVVPEASMAFHTAFNGQADFAGGIVELALAGSDVIVDDVIYFAEPMLQDGIIAQAADEVARLGVPYYSSNGNRARDAYQSDYRAVNTADGVFHDWDPGPGVDTMNEVVLTAFQTNLTFNWDNPNFSVSGAPGAQTDVDIILFDSEGNRVPDCFEPGGQSGDLCQFQFTDGGVPIDGGNGGDAIELVSLVDFVGGSQVSIGLETQSGPAPGFVKFVLFGGSLDGAEYPLEAGSGFGHNNAAGAEGVGAAAFYFTEEFEGDPNTLDLRAQAGEPWCVPACLNDFSSAGGTPIFFDTDGNRLAEPEVRFKPGITGPDGTNTSFFFTDTSRDDDDGDGFNGSNEEGEFPNFFGTSAAAPHVAAVAALLIESENSQILRKFRNGKILYWMCKKRFGDSRRGGLQRQVRPEDVQGRIDDGWVLGPCRRSEPQAIYDAKRDSAQDMNIRASNATGATVMTFDEVGPDGFDFDSGFGFIDANAALREFRKGGKSNRRKGRRKD